MTRTEAIVTITVALITQIAALAIAWLGRKEAHRAREQAREAADLARPTGNGFAGRVEAALKEIRQEVRAVRQEAADDRAALAEHIRDHTTGVLGKRNPRR